jgi:hypothetical protein
MDFLGFDDRGLVQAEVEGVGFGIEMDFHSRFLIERSKNAVTTRQGVTV